MAECPKRPFNASCWEGLKPIAVEAEAKIDKFGKTAYAAGFYISSLDDMREAARAARLHWGAGSGPRWHPGAALGPTSPRKPEKGLRPSSRR
jgi:hypothetical protein